MIVPIADKMNLTISEAAVYSNIGENKIRELIKRRDCDFVLAVGTKNLIKRKKFENYIANRDVI
ncbi:MAG: excisionase family DNA-binding protein [Bacillus sp. (in: Bacteria)]|nr:excisionase family DNA-binding protein [Bacillus sp. (in: firmicutes)]MCM1424985.1 excisionase family DNA-binding protein [Eubacterium sp.]